MNFIKKYSKLHQQLQLQEYSIPFKKLEDMRTKEEFLDYIEYYQIDTIHCLRYVVKFLNYNTNKEEFLNYVHKLQIDKRILFGQILNGLYLEYLHEYLRDEIIYTLKNGNKKLNDENLKYISQYIGIIELNASDNPNITTVKPFANTLKILYAIGIKCGIDDNGLEGTNLKELYSDMNPKISYHKHKQSTQ